MFKYTGRAIDVFYDSGNRYRIEYFAGGRLRWTSLAKASDGTPQTGDETYYMTLQGRGIYTLSWIEQDGTTVSQNLDFNRMWAYSFVTYSDPSGRGGRAFLEQRGPIRFVR